MSRYVRHFSGFVALYATPLGFVSHIAQKSRVPVALYATLSTTSSISIIVRYEEKQGGEAAPPHRPHRYFLGDADLVEAALAGCWGLAGTMRVMVGIRACGPGGRGMVQSVAVDEWAGSWRHPSVLKGVRGSVRAPRLGTCGRARAFPGTVSGFAVRSIGGTTKR